LTEEANIGTVSGTQSRCPYQGNSGERERRRYGHRLLLFIPQIAPPVKPLRSIRVKKAI
jgi:hypothetical protein